MEYFANVPQETLNEFFMLLCAAIVFTVVLTWWLAAWSYRKRIRQSSVVSHRLRDQYNESQNILRNNQKANEELNKLVDTLKTVNRGCLAYYEVQDPHIAAAGAMIKMIDSRGSGAKRTAAIKHFRETYIRARKAHSDMESALKGTWA